MKRLKRLIFTTLILVFIGHNSLPAADKWPGSFGDIIFYQKSNEISIEKCFENDSIKYFFNLGYNGERGDYSPINKNFKRDILRMLRTSLTQVLREVCSELKNCSALYEMFGDQVQENLNSFPNTISFKTNFTNGFGTVTDARTIVKADYLLNFIYNAGKQLRENQGKDLNLTPADFNIRDGAPEGESIQKTISHEMTHYLTGLMGGGLLAECIVHCLTKKCHDQNHNLREYTYKRFEDGKSIPLECDKLTENQLQNVGVGSKMGKPACFCDTDWKAIKKMVESEECDNPPPPGGDNRADTPDDNYSYSSGVSSASGASGVSNAASLSTLLASLNVFPLASGQNFISYSYYPDILVYDKFNYPDLPALLKYYNSSNNIHDYVHDSFSNNHRLLIIPSGELTGDENSIIIKEALKQFVESGGTLLVLSQQYDTQFENLVPIPETEPFKCYGWRQDQSCSIGSTYFEEMHPVLSSSTNELVSAVVDGYFHTIPSTATTLLYKTRNRESTMLYYPYGNGTVILTSLYTDWAYAHAQATTTELRIIRDLITFAKNPKLPIPMFDLEQNPTPSINLNVEIKNITETPASKAKLMVYTPNRDILLHVIEAPVSLNPGESTQIPLSFTLPELQTRYYGICHVDYELYNAENELIQLPTESDGGRFSIYKIITPVTLKDEVRQWLTVKDENVYWGQNIEVAIHFKNATAETKTLDFNDPFFNVGHDTVKIPFPSFREPLLSEVQKGCSSLKQFRNRYQSPQKGENVVYKGFQRGNDF